MYHSFSLFLLKDKLNCDRFLSEEELAYAIYNLEVLLINLEKIATIYLFSFIFQNIQTTLVVHLSYFLLRMFAGGWHARSSRGCTIMSICIFVLLPSFIEEVLCPVNTPVFIVLALGLLFTFWKYAPAGTEKKSITDSTLKRKLKRKALLMTLLLLFLAYLSPSDDLRMLILLGMSSEAVTIHPYFYQLMKRGSKND
jgi:accessory gene regulator B